MNALFATLMTLVLPLGPGSERSARQLISPVEHAQPINDTPWHLWDIRVQAEAIIYVVARPDEAAAAFVKLDLASSDSKPRVTIRLVDPSAEGAAGYIKRVLEGHISRGHVTVKRARPPPSDAPTEVSETTPLNRPSMASGAARPEAPPEGSPVWWTRVLLALALISALIGMYRIATTMQVPAITALMVGLLTLVYGFVLWGLPDVALHPNAHGWDTIRALTDFEQSPYVAWDRYGNMRLELAKVFGLGVPMGFETFQASRVCAMLTWPVSFLLGLTLFRGTIPALIFMGLLGTSAPLLYAGRGEAVASPILLMALVSAALLSYAARRRDWPTLVAGCLCLSVVASARLMGPVSAPFIGLLAFVRPWSGGATKAWLPKVAVGLTLAALMAAPHLWAMLDLMTAELGARAQSDVIPIPLVLSAMWLSEVLVLLCLVGFLGLLAKARGLALLLALWLLATTIAPSSSAAYYQDQARYHLHSLPPFFLLVTAALTQLGWIRHVNAPWVGALLLTLILLGQRTPAAVLGVEQAETEQLNHWRGLTSHLPDGSWVAVPVKTRSKARTSLPDVELMSLRPDVRVVSIDEMSNAPDGTPTFFYQPLACHARYPSEDEKTATDCHRAGQEWRLSPAHKIAIWPELDDDISARLLSHRTVYDFGRASPAAWNPRPFLSHPVQIGLYVASREPPVPAP